MVGFCYVLRCPYHRRNTLQEEGTIKPSFFRAPNLEVFQKWKAVVPRGKRGFAQSDRICELHFKASDVVHYYEHTLKDGSIFKLKRGYPYLEKTAVPSIFDPALFPDRLEELSTIADECPEKLNASIPSVTQEEISNTTPEIIDPTPEITVRNTEQLMSNNPPKSLFELIAEDLSKIKTPSADWGISFIKEKYPNVDYIACVKWKSFIPERRLIIDNLLNVKTFLKDQEFPCNSTKIKSVEDISSSLSEMDRLVICADFSDSNSSDCQVVIKDHNFQRKFCDKCGIRRKKESDSIRKRLKSKKMRILLSKSLEMSEKLWAQEE